MVAVNPYVEELMDRAFDTVQNLDDTVLSQLAVAHELQAANHLQEMINAPTRIVWQDPTPLTEAEQKKMEAQMNRTFFTADTSGDARIAEAAREFVKLYVAEKSSAVGAMEDLVQLVETIERTRR